MAARCAQATNPSLLGRVKRTGLEASGFRAPSDEKVTATWTYQHLMAAAPKNARGQKILANALTQKDLDAVVRGVLKRCDVKDGVADGIINAWESCDFKPEMVQKEIGAKKVALLKAIFGGAEEQPW